MTMLDFFRRRTLNNPMKFSPVTLQSVSAEVNDVKTDSLASNFSYLVRNRPSEAVLAGAAAIILIFITIFSLWLTERAMSDAETAAKLNDYNAKITLFLQTLRTVESSQRGYIIAGTPKFLEPYKELSEKLLPLTEELVKDAPKQLKAARTVGETLAPLKAKLNEMAETVALVEKGQAEQAVSRLKDDFGRSLTDLIEEKMNSLREAGIELVRRDAGKQRSLQQFNMALDASGAILILLFTYLSMSSLMRSNAAKEVAQQALANANRDLENTVAQRTAALTRANDEVQRFAYIISHDLRSPLVNIMGFTSELEMLRKELFERLSAASGEPVPENLGKDFDEAFGFIKSSIMRMERLIAAILRISREGTRPLSREPIDTDALIGSIAGAVAHQLRAKNATLITDPVPGVVSDRLALEQIFSNLIDNAIKFLQPGRQGEIAVRGRIEGAEAIYTVSDNGRGIDSKDYGRIFELFRRSGSQDVPGEGIGLAYVAALVRRLGGSIEVESKIGEGSVFKIRLPRAILSANKKAA